MWRGDKAVGIEFSVAVERHTLSQFIARSSRRPIYRVRGKKKISAHHNFGALIGDAGAVTPAANQRVFLARRSYSTTAGDVLVIYYLHPKA
jgi:hypothetical protein